MSADCFDLQSDRFSVETPSLLAPPAGHRVSGMRVRGGQLEVSE